jgi:hypothetical protein
MTPEKMATRTPRAKWQDAPGKMELPGCFLLYSSAKFLFLEVSGHAAEQDACRADPQPQQDGLSGRMAP